VTLIELLLALLFAWILFGKEKEKKEVKKR